ncbi:POTE ankyrin domain family member A-like isoform X3 [Callithrix jacchus]
MRRRYRVWSPPDSSDSGSEHAADAFNPICYFILPPPHYHVHLEDLGELHRAAWLGDVPGLERVLVPGGPGVDKRDSENRTALHLACASGHPAVVALLVDRKCQLNCFDSNKRTALIKAVQCRKEECATILLDGGADPDLPDIYGNTALHYAVHNEDESLAEKLLSYSTNKEAKNENDLTPLLFAVSGKRQQMVEFLLERGANLLAVDKCQRTALILAVQCGSANIVSLLLQQQIDIFSQDTFGRTAEDYAVLNQFTGIQQLISEYKEKQTPESLPQNNNPEEQDLELPSEEEEERLNGCENKQTQVEEEMKQHTSDDTELSGSLPDGAAAGSDDNGLNQQFPRKENEVHDSRSCQEYLKNISRSQLYLPCPSHHHLLCRCKAESKTSTEKNQVKNQIHFEADFADSMQPSETDSQCELSDSSYKNILLQIEQLRMKCKESVSLSRIEGAFHLYEDLLELKNNEDERLIAEIKQMENMVSVLQKEISKTKETELQLEHQKTKWELELRRLSDSVSSTPKTPDSGHSSQEIKSETSSNPSSLEICPNKEKRLRPAVHVTLQAGGVCLQPVHEQREPQPGSSCYPDHHEPESHRSVAWVVCVTSPGGQAVPCPQLATHTKFSGLQPSSPL